MSTLDLLQKFKKDLRFSREDMIGAQKFVDYIIENSNREKDQWLDSLEELTFIKRKEHLKKIGFKSK